MRPLALQTPGNVYPSLLDAIAAASTGAIEGLGVFAWATRYGLEAFMAIDNVRRIAEEGDLRLFIGTDSVTDGKALATARDIVARHARMNIQFVVNDGGSLFHPKLIWFTRPEGARLVIGSGNLTRGGLQGNWEAFTVVDVRSPDDLERAVTSWIEQVEPGALDLADSRVTAAVASNVGSERQVRRVRTRVPAIEQEQEPSAASEAEGWLIAELNKSRKNSAGQSMFSQASFDRSTFVGFFGYSGSEFELGLIPVAHDGAFLPVESRTGRYKAASVNYYFELGTVQGIPYPSTGRPIALFGRLSGGGYLYLVRLPGHSGHKELDALLTEVVGGAGNRMRRTVVSTATLQDAWPTAPVLATGALSS